VRYEPDFLKPYDGHAVTVQISENSRATAARTLMPTTALR